MLKKVSNGHFQREGSFFPRFTFHVGKYHSTRGYSKKQYQNFLEEQMTSPISLMDNPKTG